MTKGNDAMDIRTYPNDAENDRLRAENVCLDGELRVRIQQLANTSRSVGHLLTANEELRAEHQAISATNVRLSHENSALRAKVIEYENRIIHCDNCGGTWYDDGWTTVCPCKIRAELDAMRQAHSVIAARMQAMGC